MVKVTLVRDGKVDIVVNAVIWCTRMQEYLPSTFLVSYEDLVVQNLLDGEELQDGESIVVDAELSQVGYDACDEIVETP